MSGTAKIEVRTYHNYVNGQWCQAPRAKLFRFRSVHEEVIAPVSAADKTDVDAAVKSAREAFDLGPWSKLPRKIAVASFQAGRENPPEAASLADLESRTPASPSSKPNTTFADVATCFEYYGGLAQKSWARQPGAGQRGSASHCASPIGVAAQIIPELPAPDG